MLWTVAVALAGLKAMPIVPGEGWVPVQPVPAGQIEGQVTCVEWAGSGLPRVVPCAVGAAGAVDPLRRDAASGSLLGIVPLSTGPLGARAIPRGGVIAVEAAWSSVLTATRRGAAMLQPDVDAAAAWCRQPPTGAFVMEAAVGCSRTAAVGELNPAAPPKPKELLDRWVEHAPGTWMADNAKATTCTGTPVVVAVRPVPVAEVCAADVLPRALAGVELQLSTFKASPDAVAAPVKGLFGDLSSLRATLGNVDASLTALKGDLDVSGTALTGFRGRVEGLDMGDSRWVALLTRLERLESDTKESGVVLGSHAKRLEALKAEAESLEEKASQPGLDVLLVQRLGTQVHEVLQRLEELDGEVNGLIIRVSAIRQGVGYLEGGLAVGLGPAAE